MGWFKMEVHTAEKSSTRGGAGPVMAEDVGRKLVVEQSMTSNGDGSKTKLWKRKNEKRMQWYIQHGGVNERKEGRMNWNRSEKCCVPGV